MRLRQRAAEYREVLGVHEHGATVDRSPAGDDAVAQVPFVRQPELSTTGPHTRLLLAIYSYFASKDDIFLALAEEGFNRLDENVRRAMNTGDPLENVRACWWAFYEFSKDQPEYFLLMFVDRTVPRITQEWEGFEFLQEMLAHAVAAIQRAIDAGALPSSLNPNVAMHMLWAGLIGPAVVGIRHRLASGEDYDALARDVLNATIAGLQSGVNTTFVSCKCADEGVAGAPVPAGVRRHES